MKLLHTFNELEDSKKKAIIGAAALVLMVLIVVILVVVKPFYKEQVQVAELRTLGQDEKKVSNVSSDITRYVQADKTVKYVDQALLAFQGQQGTKVSTSTGVTSQVIDPFNVNVIDAETAQFATTTQFINNILMSGDMTPLDTALQQF